MLWVLYLFIETIKPNKVKSKRPAQLLRDQLAQIRMKNSFFSIHLCLYELTLKCLGNIRHSLENQVTDFEFIFSYL